MAQTRGQRAAPTKGQALAPNERGNQPSRAVVRRSARLNSRRAQTAEHTESSHTPPPSVALHQKDHPTSPVPIPRKRLRTGTDLLEHTHEEPPRKRRRSSRRHTVEETIDEEAADEDVDGRADTIAFWAREKKWPPVFFEQSDMEHLLARKKSSSALGRKRSEAGSSSTTPHSTQASDQKPREEKSAQYRDPRYKVLLETKGSFMDKSNLGITNASKMLCQDLLEREQVVPLGLLPPKKCW